MWSGGPICALRASAPRTSVNASSGWPTPMAGTPAQKGYNESGSTENSRKTVNLVAGPVLRTTGWGTPRSTDGDKNAWTREGALRFAKRKFGNNDLVTTVHLFPARTDSHGVLNPEFSLWLMLGPFATAWLSSGVRATR